MGFQDNPVLLLGYNVRSLAQSARHGGFKALAYDFFGDQDRGPGYSLRQEGAASFHLKGLVEKVLACSPSPLIWAGGLENRPDLIDRMAYRHWIWGNGARVVKEVRLGTGVRDMAERGGIRCPRQLARGRVPGTGRWLRKPMASGGGHGIRWAVAGESIGPGEILQEWIPGEAVSLTFLADGRRLLASWWTWAGQHEAGSFRYQGGILCPQGIPGAEPGEALAAAVVEKFGLIGFNGLDFILYRDQLTYLEINPRWTGSVELWERATGCSAFFVLAELMNGRVNRLPSPLRWVGKRIVYARKKSRWDNKAERLLAGVLADIPWPEETFGADEPVCTVFATGDTREDVLKTLRERQEIVWTAIEG